jgi:hypothetical protein
MKIFMRDWVEKEYSLPEPGVVLSCGCRVASLSDGIHAKWVEYTDHATDYQYGLVCETCFFMWGCEHAGT